MSAEAASCWAVIPVKAPGAGKTRLAGVLDAGSREQLVRAMLEQVVEAAQRCRAVERVCLVGPSDHGFGDRLTVIEDHSDGLNEALSSAMALLPSRPPPSWGQEPYSPRILILAADLPQLAAADIAMLADVPDGAIGIAPDRHGTGTNALSLPWSGTTHFGFRFGAASFAAHRAEAERLGYKVEVLLSDGLEKDIDEAADLADAVGCLEEAL